MIGKISGRIDYRATDHVMIDVRGVGYIVHVSDRTLASLPAVGEFAALYTELLVRQDILQLFGFSTLLEKEWHRLLTSVQGIGSKGSLAILGALGPEGVSRAIALGDYTAIKAAKGVGPKTALRVVNELKDKAPQLMAMGGTMAAVAAPNTAPEDGADAVIETPQPQVQQPPPSAAAQSEALSALSNLGYGPGEAAGAVAQAAGDDSEADTASLIRAALKLLAPKG